MRLDELFDPLAFRTEMRGHHHGQSDLTLTATRSGQPVGRIDFSEYEGAPHIQMIEVSPGERRRGVALAMLQELQRAYPGVEIDWGMLTGDGAALYASVPFIDVPNEEIQAKMQRLEHIKAALARFEAIAAAYHTNPSPATRDALTALDSDLWNRLSDEVDDLEHEMVDAKPFRRLVRT